MVDLGVALRRFGSTHPLALQAKPADCSRGRSVIPFVIPSDQRPSTSGLLDTPVCQGGFLVWDSSNGSPEGFNGQF